MNDEDSWAAWRVICGIAAYLATIGACVANAGWVVGLAIGIFALGPLAGAIAFGIAPFLLFVIGAAVIFVAVAVYRGQW